MAGAWLNSAAYGFRFDAGNQWFELAQIRWLQNPSLYPGDPVREAFARYPTVFAPLVAWLGRWATIEHILFWSFLLTKLLFFGALARLVAGEVRSRSLTSVIVAAVALSPVLNDLTPLAHSDVLNSIQTHTSVAVALLLWVGVLLIEGRWVAAALLAGATAYLDGLFVAHSLAAFVAFAVVDWRRCRNRIIPAGLLGTALALPWALGTRGVIWRVYPPGYVRALLAFYPFHLTLRFHEAYELTAGAGVVLAAVAMGGTLRRAGLDRAARLERLVWVYGWVVLAGALAGEFFLTPSLARLQLLRGDSFLDLYAVVLIQISGARLLIAQGRPVPALRWVACWLAILLPLGGEWALVWALLLALGSSQVSAQLWRTGGVESTRGDWRRRMLAAGLAAAIVATFVLGWREAGSPIRWAGLWNPAIPLSQEQADWRAAQLWASEHSTRDSRFLVPTFPGGFRFFSGRT